MTISDSDIQSNNGSKVVVDAIYKRDALSAVSDVYQNFMSLLNTRRGSTETLKTLSQDSMLRYPNSMHPPAPFSFPKL